MESGVGVNRDGSKGWAARRGQATATGTHQGLALDLMSQMKANMASCTHFCRLKYMSWIRSCSCGVIDWLVGRLVSTRDGIGLASN